MAAYDLNEINDRALQLFAVCECGEKQDYVSRGRYLEHMGDHMLTKIYLDWLVKWSSDKRSSLFPVELQDAQAEADLRSMRLPKLTEAQTIAMQNKIIRTITSFFDPDDFEEDAAIHFSRSSSRK